MAVDAQLASFFTAAIITILGLYSALFLDNVIKKTIGLSFIGEGVNLFLITLGYKPGGIVYIYLPEMAKEWFVANSTYPLPYALVLTNIVIGASTVAVMLGLIIVLYKKHGSLSASIIMNDDEAMQIEENNGDGL